MVSGNIDDVLQAGIDKSIEEGWLLDVTYAIRIRFKIKKEATHHEQLLLK